MSEEQLKAFLEKVKGDTSLQEKLKAAADAEAVVAIAIEAGFGISADDLKSAQSETSDEELEGAAGGRGTNVFDVDEFDPSLEKLGRRPLRIPYDGSRIGDGF